MAGDERLHEVRAVGVAVEVDLPEPERAQDGREVPGRVDRREQVGGVTAGRPAPVAALDLAGARRRRPPGTSGPEVTPANAWTDRQSMSAELPVPRLSTSSSPRSRRSGR